MGYKNEQIAFQMGVSVGTVKSYLQHVFLKIGVQSKTELRLKFYNFDFERNPPYSSSTFGPAPISATARATANGCFPRVFIFGDTRYSVRMNTLSKLPTDLRRRRGLTLILTADKAHTGITEFIAAQILYGPLFVISGNEWLPAFELTRIIRRKTLQVRETLNHLYTTRASTCYRLFDSLANIPSHGEPILVLDFLHTFYDADIPFRVLLFRGMLCAQAPRSTVPSL
jgi:hypothetical protein